MEEEEIKKTEEGEGFARGFILNIELEENPIDITSGVIICSY